MEIILRLLVFLFNYHKSGFAICREIIAVNPVNKPACKFNQAVKRARIYFRVGRN